MKVPTVAGSVSAGILIGGKIPSKSFPFTPPYCEVEVNSRDEIDVECLGGDPANFQTNIFAPSPKDSNPHYGEYSSTEKVQGNISDFHAYSIDWNAKRIIWSVDGKPVRTLTKGTDFSATEIVRKYPKLACGPFSRTKQEERHVPLSFDLYASPDWNLGC